MAVRNSACWPGVIAPSAIFQALVSRTRLENSRVLETNAWKIAEGAMTPGQQAELRTAIGHWLEANASAGAVFFRRPQELASSIRQAGDKDSRPGSVFSLVGLDPTSGLDPAVREVTRTRLFAERALFAL